MFQNCSRRPKLRVKTTKDPMFSGQKSTCSGPTPPSDSGRELSPTRYQVLCPPDLLAVPEGV